MFFSHIFTIFVVENQCISDKRTATYHRTKASASGTGINLTPDIWLHFGSDEEAEMAATYHSIISTVKTQGRSAWEYLGKFLPKYLTAAGIFSVCDRTESDWQYANS